MLDKDTPPMSPEVRDSLSSDDEMMLEEDAYEVIDMEEANIATDDLSDNENDGNYQMDNSAEEASSQNDDATYIFRGHANGYSVFCCSLSKNGELAATGSEEDKAYLWNTITGEIILECNGHRDSVIFAEFSFNDMYLATGDMSGIIKLWRISDKTCVWETSLYDITWIKWHNSAMVLLVGLETGEVCMLKVPQGSCKIFAHGQGDRAETGIILPDGKRAAVGYHSGTIRVIDLKTKAVLSVMACDSTRSYGHSSAITTLDCHIDNNLLISASVDGQTILSIANSGKIVYTLQDLNSNKEETSTEDNVNNISVEVAAFCKDSTFPVAATGTIEKNSNGKIYIWDISKKALRHEIDQEAGVTKLIWTNTSILFTAGLDGILRCFNARGGHCIRSFSGHKAAILDLYITKEKALTVSDDNTARIFDISSTT